MKVGYNRPRYQKGRSEIREENSRYITKILTMICRAHSLSREQRQVIKDGLLRGLSYGIVEQLAKPEYSAKYMNKLKTRLLNGETIEMAIENEQKLNRQHRNHTNSNENEEGEVQNPDKSKEQHQISDKQRQIAYGLKNPNIARGRHLFDDLSLTKSQIIQIQYGLECKLPLKQVAFFAKHKYSGKQMAQICLGMKHGLPMGYIEMYSNASLSPEQMAAIREGLESRLQVENSNTCNSDAESQEKSHCTSVLDLEASSCRNIVHKAPVYEDVRKTAMEVSIEHYFSEKVNANLSEAAPHFWKNWLHSKQVFIFDDILSENVISHAEAVEDLPSNVLLHSPYSTVFIIAKKPGGGYFSFFASLSGTTLEISTLCDAKLHENYRLELFEEKNLKLTLQNAPVTQQEQIRSMLQLLTCLCAASPCEQNISTPAKKHPLNASTGIEKRSEISSDLTVYTVKMEKKDSTKRSVSTYRLSTHKQKAHMRRAHWHSYWIGPRNDADGRHKELRWIPEICVNTSEDILPIRIVLVKTLKS